MTYNPWPKVQTTTTAGSAGRSQDAEVQSSTQKKFRAPRRGTIIEIYKKDGVTSLPFVKVRWDNEQDITSGWIPLDEHPMMMAMTFAAKLEDLVGEQVKVHFHNQVSSTGSAKIVSNKIVDPDNYDPQVESAGVKLI